MQSFTSLMGYAPYLVFSAGTVVTLSYFAKRIACRRNVVSKTSVNAQDSSIESATEVSDSMDWEPTVGPQTTLVEKSFSFYEKPTIATKRSQAELDFHAKFFGSLLANMRPVPSCLRRVIGVNSLLPCTLPSARSTDPIQRSRRVRFVTEPDEPDKDLAKIRFYDLEWEEVEMKRRIEDWEDLKPKDRQRRENLPPWLEEYGNDCNVPHVKGDRWLRPRHDGRIDFIKELGVYYPPQPAVYRLRKEGLVTVCVPKQLVWEWHGKPFIRIPRTRYPFDPPPARKESPRLIPRPNRKPRGPNALC